MSRNDLLLPPFCSVLFWLMMPSLQQHESAWCSAALYDELHQAALLNANPNTANVTLVTHDLSHGYLASFVQNGWDDSPATFHPGAELTQTAADGVISSFLTFSGTSRQANLAASLCPGSDEVRREASSWCEDDSPVSP